MKTDLYDDRSVVSLLRRLRDETSQLLRQEVSLAKAEMGEKVSSLGRNIAFLIVGGVVLFAGLMFILESINRLIHVGLIEADVSADVATWLAPLVVGLLVAGIGIAMTMLARRALKEESLVPEQTVQTMKDNKQWIADRLK